MDLLEEFKAGYWKSFRELNWPSTWINSRLFRFRLFRNLSVHSR